ncbi:ComEA family DNA-binding protein [Mannheimia granulomatis]|uniref:ComEA family DNA-binding protein n=1 Tax=Mannheimia granulomatis TaxID=85402 RepID=UPI00047AC2B5|nr:helix-hairpin-helix domain-containing protein [Mannheimia granulomatis]QLB19592.1 transporter [Mannheimia granulomatis]
MKKIKAFTLSLLIGLSSHTFAQTQPITNTEQTSSTQAVEQVTNQSKINPNAVNINLASAAELQDKLVGIGEKKAQAIVDYRTKNGNFKSIEQLTEVSGIGQATLEKNRANIVLE